MVYIPTIIIDEIEDIRREDKVNSRVDAFKELVQYARVGREVKRLTDFGTDWSKKKKNRKPVGNYKIIPQKYDIFGGL